MFPSIIPIIFIFILSSFIAVYYRRRTSFHKSLGSSDVGTAPIKKLKGPSCPSWLAGHVQLFLKPERAGEEDELLIRQFGLTCKIKIALNVDTIYTADPKALQYVLNTSGYNFHKETAKLHRIILGKSILGVDGEEHARQRRVLLPSFSQSHLRELVPAFAQATAKVIEQWKDLVAVKQGGGIDVDVYLWLSRVTLDALGQGVLSYDFGALSEKPSEYVGALQGLLVDMFNNRTDFQIAMGSLFVTLPDTIGRFLLGAAVRGMDRFEHFLAISNEMASSIFTREKDDVLLGESQSKDLLSTLIRANKREDPKNRLSNDEVMSQLQAFTIAGHSTTSFMLQWIFYELALHPEAQATIREEIKAVKEAKGIQELSASELDSLHYTNAVLKESLRLHPIGLYIVRRADRDDIIPLAYPVKAASEQEVQAIHIKRGQAVFMSVHGYNRIEDLWGPDPDKWIPERFLSARESERSKRTLGVFAHLATFGSGAHSCIGWRFAVLAMQTILTGLLEHFEFTPASSNPVILQKLATHMYPSVKGQEERGAQMPLFIKPVS